MHEAGLSDEQLSAELKKWTGGTPALHPVGELLDRHWEAAFAYARLCADGTRAAGMLTTAAFTRLFGESLRQTGPTAAWRPQVLVAVRRIAAEWDIDGRQELLHPALRSGDDGERVAARMLPPAGRRQLSRAFQRVPQTSRAVLWHTEVEAEPLSVPAALLGLDLEDTGIELRRARERLREECLQAHRELAPEEECRRYLRMLDVTFRRGGVDVDPDLRRHLGRCDHCSRTADQLASFNTGLGLALAEAVLGWGAHAYVRSRATRAEELAEPAPPPETVAPPSGEAFPPSEAPLHDRSAEPGRPAGSAGSPAGSGLAASRRRRGSGGPVSGDGSAEPPRRRGRSAGSARRGGTPEPTRPNGSAAPTRRHGSAGRGEARPAGDPAEPAADASFAAPPRRRRSADPTRADGSAPAAHSHGSARTARSAGRETSPTSGEAAPTGRSAHRAARTRRVRRRNLALAVGTVSGLVVVPLVLWSVLGSGGGHDPSGAASSLAPGKAPSRSGASSAGAASAGEGALHGRLHNLASGLCVGVVGKKAVKGAETELARCSGEVSQQWTYETDGLLRNSAAPELCLDSHLGYSVLLAPCAATGRAAKNIRYDFTLQGALIPRWNQDLALAPAATDGSGALVLKNRVTGAAQRWSVDTAKPSLEMQNVNWDSDTSATPTATAHPAPTVPKASEPAPSPTPTPTVTRTSPTPTPSTTPDPCAAYPYYCGGGYGGGYGGGGYGGGGYGGGGYDWWKHR